VILCRLLTVIAVHLQLIVPPTLDTWLPLAELIICFVTIRAETHMLVVDIGSKYRRSSRAQSGLGLRNYSKVLSEQTSTIEGIAG